MLTIKTVAQVNDEIQATYRKHLRKLRSETLKTLLTYLVGLLVVVGGGIALFKVLGQPSHPTVSFHEPTVDKYLPYAWWAIYGTVGIMLVFLVAQIAIEVVFFLRSARSLTKPMRGFQSYGEEDFEVKEFGTTLWEIAACVYGEGVHWKKLLDANKNRIMPDGTRFTGAEPLRVGWFIRCPGVNVKEALSERRMESLKLAMMTVELISEQLINARKKEQEGQAAVVAAPVMVVEPEQQTPGETGKSAEAHEDGGVEEWRSSRVLSLPKAETPDYVSYIDTTIEEAFARAKQTINSFHHDIGLSSWNLSAVSINETIRTFEESGDKETREKLAVLKDKMARYEAELKRMVEEKEKILQTIQTLDLSELVPDEETEDAGVATAHASTATQAPPEDETLTKEPPGQEALAVDEPLVSAESETVEAETEPKVEELPVIEQATTEAPGEQPEEEPEEVEEEPEEVEEQPEEEPEEPKAEELPASEVEPEPKAPETVIVTNEPQVTVINLGSPAGQEQQAEQVTSPELQELLAKEGVGVFVVRPTEQGAPVGAKALDVPEIVPQDKAKLIAVGVPREVIDETKQKLREDEQFLKTVREQREKRKLVFPGMDNAQLHTIMHTAMFCELIGWPAPALFVASPHTAAVRVIWPKQEHLEIKPVTEVTAKLKNAIMSVIDDSVERLYTDLTVRTVAIAREPYLLSWISNVGKQCRPPVVVPITLDDRSETYFAQIRPPYFWLVDPEWSDLPQKNLAPLSLSVDLIAFSLNPNQLKASLDTIPLSTPAEIVAATEIVVEENLAKGALVLTSAPSSKVADLILLAQSSRFGDRITTLAASSPTAQMFDNPQPNICCVVDGIWVGGAQVVTTEAGFWSDRYVCVLSGTVFGTPSKEGAIAVELCLEKGQIEDNWRVMPIKSLSQEMGISPKELQKKLELLVNWTGGMASLVLPSKRQGWQVRVHKEVMSSLSLMSEELKRKPEVAIKYLASITNPVQASTLPASIAEKVRNVLLQVAHKITSMSISSTFGMYQQKYIEKAKETIEKILENK